MRWPFVRRSRFEAAEALNRHFAELIREVATGLEKQNVSDRRQLVQMKEMTEDMEAKLERVRARAREADEKALLVAHLVGIAATRFSGRSNMES